MPLPKPKDGENHKDWMERCMGLAMMIDEFPDEKQRFAVCQSQWDTMHDRLGPRPSERRAFPIAELRVSRTAEHSAQILGHAAVFDQLSEDLGGFRERIAPGAFSGSLKGDVRALFNHDPNLVLGRTASKTLRLQEDAVGLAIEITPPDTTMARDLLMLIERGDISQMSFGFRTLKDAWSQLADEIVRTLIEVELFDVSPVTFPAYPQTDVAVRALEAWRAGTGAAQHAADRRRRLRLASLDEKA